jgi:hypothetical protein
MLALLCYIRSYAKTLSWNGSVNEVSRTLSSAAKVPHGKLTTHLHLVATLRVIRCIFILVRLRSLMLKQTENCNLTYFTRSLRKSTEVEINFVNLNWWGTASAFHSTFPTQRSKCKCLYMLTFVRRLLHKIHRLKINIIWKVEANCVYLFIPNATIEHTDN